MKTSNLDKERDHVRMRSYRNGSTKTVLARPMSKQLFKNCYEYRAGKQQGKNGAGYYIIDGECEKWLPIDEFRNEFRDLLV